VIKGGRVALKTLVFETWNLTRFSQWPQVLKTLQSPNLQMWNLGHMALGAASLLSIARMLLLMIPEGIAILASYM
jgi:hypothetical protein